MIAYCLLVRFRDFALFGRGPAIRSLTRADGSLAIGSRSTGLREPTPHILHVSLYLLRKLMCDPAVGVSRAAFEAAACATSSSILTLRKSRPIADVFSTCLCSKDRHFTQLDLELQHASFRRLNQHQVGIDLSRIGIGVAGGGSPQLTKNSSNQSKGGRRYARHQESSCWQWLPIASRGAAAPDAQDRWGRGGDGLDSPSDSCVAERRPADLRGEAACQAQTFWEWSMADITAVTC